ncbi:MAG: Mini-ribonuclease 3 [Clostridia bacterium]|nr:Mini-ribonuclease 3 [Clostridia bacterium]MBR2391760.1 Mini-ribonuclease 3 [Clostridia bacterium]
MQIEVLEKEKVKVMQPLVLAMIGDSVQTLFVRTHIAKEFGVKVNKMNKMVSSVVSAGSQFKTFKKIEESLTEEEQDIARRARNSHIHTKAKNFSYAEYIHATALEALIGYLHLSGQNERLNQILALSLEELEQ